MFSLRTHRRAVRDRCGTVECSGFLGQRLYVLVRFLSVPCLVASFPEPFVGHRSQESGGLTPFVERRAALAGPQSPRGKGTTFYLMNCGHNHRPPPSPPPKAPCPVSPYLMSRLLCVCHCHFPAGLKHEKGYFPCYTPFGCDSMELVFR